MFSLQKVLVEINKINSYRNMISENLHQNSEKSSFPFFLIRKIAPRYRCLKMQKFFFQSTTTNLMNFCCLFQFISLFGVDTPTKSSIKAFAIFSILNFNGNLAALMFCKKNPINFWLVQFTMISPGFEWVHIIQILQMNKKPTFRQKIWWVTSCTGFLSTPDSE